MWLKVLSPEEEIKNEWFAVQTALTIAASDGNATYQKLCLIGYLGYGGGSTQGLLYTTPTELQTGRWSMM